MLVSYQWLQEYVPVPFPARDVADRLTMAGLEVEDVRDCAGVPVLDVGVTSNRGDALSMVGIAREVAALSGNHVTHPLIDVQERGPAVTECARVIVEAPDLCPRYAARVIRGVHIGPAPDWVQRRLAEAGIRPINNVVDATNYVMLELGQPLHAFDLDRVRDATIVVRRARQDEPLTTLDGIERRLTPTMLVIADATHPVALAGIMGGQDSEVTPETTNLLLESAHFDRATVRKTARAHTLSTESSYRFERIVDPAGVGRALDRVAQLIVAWAGGTVAAGVIDIAEPLPPARAIGLSPARVNTVLGTEIAPAEMMRVLRALELGVAGDADGLTVTIPTFRPDLQQEMDLIEEVARIHGYQHIPTTVPGHITGAGRQAPEMAFEDDVRELLAAAGLFEGLSYSLIDYRILDLMGFSDASPERAQVVALRNPKSDEYTHLRPTMLVSMLEALRNNARRNIEDVQLFELGRIFRTTGGGFRFNYTPHEAVDVDMRVQQAEQLPLEQRAVGIALMGRPWTSRWGGGDADVDFYYLKGLLEQLLADLNVVGVACDPAQHPTLHPGRTAVLRVEQAALATFGEVHPRVAAAFDLPRRAYLADIDLDAVMRVAGGARPRPALSRFPATDRDIACLVRRDHPAEAVRAIIVSAAGSLQESVALFDVYTGTGIPDGYRSLAYRITFRAADRTLSDEEVDAAMDRIRRALVDEAGITLR